MPKLTANILDTYYREAEAIDQGRIDRFKSYGRLKNGDHFYQAQHQHLRNYRFYESRNPKKRLRLVQNHISRFVNTWVNSIVNAAPDVEILPNNKQEERDRKAAELHRSAKAHIIEETDFYSIQETLVDDYVTYGEAIVKMQFDSSLGALVPGEVKTVQDQQGNIFQIQEEMPAGQMVFTRVDPENLLRDPGARSWNETRWVCHRSTMDKPRLIRIISSIYDEETARDMINSLQDQDETINVFNGTDLTSSEEGNKRVSIREFYFKPDIESPNGLYVLATAGKILFRTELPASVFPFEFLNFEDVHGSPRGESRIKQLSPIQLEINRCISKMAEHQITLGDDKLITTAGSKVAEVKKYEGIRHFQVSGGIAPSVLPGRAGDQYVGYYERSVLAFNLIAELPDISEDKVAGLDPFAIFFLSSKQKLKFAKHASKFERFLIRLWRKALKLHKHHVHPNAIIPIVGASDEINIDEYKSSTDTVFQIKLKVRTEDPESLIARQFQINQFLQYAGGNLDEADLGMLAKNSPFLHSTDFALKSTLKAERAQNMLLKLDKGLDLPVSQADDPNYMLQRLDARMSQADFDTIDYRRNDGIYVPTQMIQQLYQQKRQQYLALVQEQMQAELRQKAGQIPVTGSLIPVQMYESELQEDGDVTTKRVQLPQDALEWLVSTLKLQGVSESTFGQFAPQTESDLRNAIEQSTEPLNQAQIMQTNLDNEGVF